MKFKDWSRMNPKVSIKLDMARLNLLFDGDHAIEGSGAMRRSVTVEDVIQRVEKIEAFLIAEKELEEGIESFKINASNGDICINLEDVNDTMFFDSVHMDEFWRVCYEVYQNQKY